MLAPVRNPSSRPTILSVPVWGSAITTPSLPRWPANVARALSTARAGATGAPDARLSNSAALARRMWGALTLVGRADAVTAETTESSNTAASAATAVGRRAPG